MQALREKPYRAEVRARGQITIPKRLRERYHIEEGSPFMLIPLGGALVLAPRPLPAEEARKKLRKLLRESGLTVGDLLDGLDEERKRLASERYR